MIDQPAKRISFAAASAEVFALASRDAGLKSELNSFERRSRFSFYGELSPVWWMEHSDKAGIIALVALTKPRVVIEIGSLFAGSAAYFAEHAENVFCVDIDPNVTRRCAPFKNIEVLIGSSAAILPRLIQRIEAEFGGFDLALVDGDHTREGVRADINALIANRPSRSAWIAMHDSFNPIVRSGILSADWQKPWINNVEIDFVPGNLMSEDHVYKEMWGGIALAELSPLDRAGPLHITKNAELMFRAAKRTISVKGLTKRLRSVARAVRKKSR